MTRTVEDVAERMRETARLRRLRSWSDALDLQVEFGGWLASPAGQLRIGEFLDGLKDDDHHEHLDLGALAAVGLGLIKGDPIGGGGWSAGLKITSYDTFYASPDIKALVDGATTSFEPEALLMSDIPSDTGFLVIPSFLADGACQAVSWVTYQTNEDGEAGVLLNWFSPIHLDRWGPLMPTGISVWLNQADHEHAYHSALDARATAENARWLQVLWRLSQQTIITGERQPADRPARRRAQRAGRHDPYVTVITLRRAHRQGDDAAPGTREYSHRWLVGGHWRNQWYPSLGQHRRIWVNPYVKGPADKELRIRDHRVFNVTR